MSDYYISFDHDSSFVEEYVNGLKDGSIDPKNESHPLLKKRRRGYIKYANDPSVVSYFEKPVLNPELMKVSLMILAKAEKNVKNNMACDPNSDNLTEKVRDLKNLTAEDDTSSSSKSYFNYILVPEIQNNLINYLNRFIADGIEGKKNIHQIKKEVNKIVDNISTMILYMRSKLLLVYTPTDKTRIINGMLIDISSKPTSRNIQPGFRTELEAEAEEIYKVQQENVKDTMNTYFRKRHDAAVAPVAEGSETGDKESETSEELDGGSSQRKMNMPPLIGGTNMFGLIVDSDINTRISKMKERVNQSIRAYNFKLNTNKRLTRKEFFSNEDEMHLNMMTHDLHPTKDVRKIKKLEPWHKLKYEKKIHALYNIMKELGYIFKLDNNDPFDMDIWNLLKFQVAIYSHFYPHNTTENLTKFFDDIFEVEIKWMIRTDINKWWLPGRQLRPDEVESYKTRLAVIYSNFKRAYFRINENPANITYLLIDEDDKRGVMFDDLCKAIGNTETGCNKFIIECVFNAEIHNRGFNGIYIPGMEYDTEAIAPGWDKCSVYLDDDNYWPKIIEDVDKTPPIIIFAILTIFNFKIKDTTYYLDGKPISFFEFESYNSWLKDTLERELTAEIKDEKRKEEVHQKIKNNIKLRELFNVYLDLVPHDFLNTTANKNKLENQREAGFRSQPHALTLRSKFAAAIADQVEKQNRAKGTIRGGGIKANDKYLLRALGHQLYDLNKSINSFKQTGGEDLYVEDGSNFSTGMATLLSNKEVPSYSTKIQGLVNILDKMQSMDADLKETLRESIDTIRNQETQMLGIQLILGHLIGKSNEMKDITYDNDSIIKLMKKFVKKDESKKDELIKALSILKSHVTPLFDHKMTGMPHIASGIPYILVPP